MHTNVPRHARVSNFEVTFWLTYFQNTANTMKSRRSLGKKLRFGRGRKWRRSLVFGGKQSKFFDVAALVEFVQKIGHATAMAETSHFRPTKPRVFHGKRQFLWRLKHLYCVCSYCVCCWLYVHLSYRSCDSHPKILVARLPSISKISNILHPQRDRSESEMRHEN